MVALMAVKKDVGWAAWKGGDLAVMSAVCSDFQSVVMLVVCLVLHWVELTAVQKVDRWVVVRAGHWAAPEVECWAALRAEHLAPSLAVPLAGQWDGMKADETVVRWAGYLVEYMAECLVARLAVLTAVRLDDHLVVHLVGRLVAK